MKRFEHIQKMSVEEMAEFFSSNSFPNLPHSACDICQYNEGLFCNKLDGCTNEYKAYLYEEWLNEKLSN